MSIPFFCVFSLFLLSHALAINLEKYFCLKVSWKWTFFLYLKSRLCYKKHNWEYHFFSAHFNPTFPYGGFSTNAESSCFFMILRRNGAKILGKAINAENQFLFHGLFGRMEHLHNVHYTVGVEMGMVSVQPRPANHLLIRFKMSTYRQPLRSHVAKRLPRAWV